eukprot:355501-Chlamydomonas_euryale.AAC.3
MHPACAPHHARSTPAAPAVQRARRPSDALWWSVFFHPALVVRHLLNGLFLCVCQPRALAASFAPPTIPCFAPACQPSLERPVSVRVPATHVPWPPPSPPSSPVLNLQVSYLLNGLFSRACRSLGNPDKQSEIIAEAVRLRELLVSRYHAVAFTLEV